MASRNYPYTASATNAIPFDQPVTSLPALTISGPTTFTKVTTGAQVGYGAIRRITANGTDTPDFSAFKKSGSGDWVNTNGVVNQCIFFYDGVDYCVAFNQLTVISGGGDVTPPEVLSMIATDANTIQVSFDETVTISTAGWSFKKNGSNNPVVSVTNTAPATYEFTLTNAMVDTDTIVGSYNSGTGSTVDSSSNELVSFTDQPVTNSIPGGSYDADAEAYFTAAGISDTPTKNAVDDLTVAWKAIRAGAVWTATKHIHPLAGPNLAAQMYNLRNPATYQGTTHGSMVYDADGLNYDGVDDWVSIGWKNNTGYTNEDKICEGIYIGSNPVATGGAAYGNISTGSKDSYFFPKESSGKMIVNLNDDAGSQVLNSPTVGIYIFNRVASTGFKAYKNGVEALDATVAPSGTLSDRESPYGGVNNNLDPITSPILFTDGLHGLYFRIDLDLTPTEVGQLNTAIQTYITAMGR